MWVDDDDGANVMLRLLSGDDEPDGVNKCADAAVDVNNNWLKFNNLVVFVAEKGETVFEQKKYFKTHFTDFSKSY